MALLLGRFVTRFSKRLRDTPSVAFLSSEKFPSTNKKVKGPLEIRINLIEKNNDLNVISLESAKKLANHRGLRLTPVENPAHWMYVGDREPYQLLHPGSKVALTPDNDVKARGFRGLKKVIFSEGIHDHDIEIRKNKIVKWVAGGYVVDVAIDVSERSDKIRSQIEDLIKDSVKLPGVLKRKSATVTRIQYEPLKKKSSTETASSDS